jgi:ribose transport system permease protein
LAIAAVLLAGLIFRAANAAAVVLAGIEPLLASLAVVNSVTGLDPVLTLNTVVPASMDFLTLLYGPDR